MKGGEIHMKKIIALFTAVMFALTLGVAFAQEKAAPMPEKKAEEKAPAKKKSHKEKKKEKKAKKAEEKKAEAPMAAPAAK
jgi:preprotein translocase subunit SecG